MWRSAPVDCLGAYAMLLLFPASFWRQVSFLQLQQSHQSCHVLGRPTCLGQLVTAEHVDRITQYMCRMLPHIHSLRRDAPVACLGIPATLIHPCLEVTSGGSLCASFSQLASLVRLTTCPSPTYRLYLHDSETRAGTPPVLEDSVALSVSRQQFDNGCCLD